jgi:hypothetical protein
LRLRYWSYGRLKRGSIVLLRVTDQRALAALGLKKQFSYFEGEAPSQLTRFDLIARSASGRLLDLRYIDLRLIQRSQVRTIAFANPSP